MSLFGKKNKESENDLFKQNVVSTPLKLGIALSGGGTRGLAYLGVFKALEENGIRFDYAAGTSIGSLMAAVYASGIPVDKMIERAKGITEKDVLSNRIRIFPSKSEKFENLITTLLDGKNFEDLDIPLTVVATDIISGKELRITKGHLPTAIAGSCAVPIIFKPVDFESYRLYDGGLVNNIPADVVRDMGADIVIAFDINAERGCGTESQKYFDELKTAFSILMKSNSLNGYVYSDYVVKLDLSKFDRTKLNNRDEMILQGYQQTIEQMPKILEIIESQKVDENIKKTAKRVKAMKKARDKFEKQQQKLIEKGVILDSKKKRSDYNDILITGDEKQ